MFFRCADSGDFDLRVRITNGRSEVVIKRGDHHAADRTETIQTIDPEQFVGLIRVFRQFPWDSVKVGARTSYNFSFNEGILVSLVHAEDISYLEIEKMTEKKDLARTKIEVEQIAGKLGINPIRTKSEYYKLCQKFTDKTDWPLEDKEEHYDKLAKVLRLFEGRIKSNT